MGWAQAVVGARGGPVSVRVLFVDSVLSRVMHAGNVLHALTYFVLVLLVVKLSW